MFDNHSFNPRTREGATVADPRKRQASLVSIHAPVRVRRAAHAPRRCLPCFNPRTREGATARPDAVNDRGNVSIHAPVRVRQIVEDKINDLKKFQSTHP